MATPYQLASPQASLYRLLHQSQADSSEANIALRKQKGKMSEDFEAELKKAQDTARSRAKKNKGWGQLLNVLGMGLGPLGAGLAGGVSSLMQGYDAKEGRKKLLEGVDTKRWGKTFLRDPSRAYKEEAEDLQLSDMDIFGGALTGGLTSYMMSGLLDGDEGGGLFKRMGEAKKGSGVVKEAITEARGLAPGTLDKASISLPPEGKGGLKDILGEGFDMKSLNLPEGISESVLTSKNPAWKELIESFKGMGTSGNDVSEELQSAIMLPLLLQQMIGGQY